MSVADTDFDMFLRRALIQMVRADEKMKHDTGQLKQFTGEDTLTAELLDIVYKNADERRKAALQVVRHIERKHDMTPYNNKKRKKKRK